LSLSFSFSLSLSFSLFVPVAHACNTSYSGVRDQEVQSQPRQIVHQTLSRKRTVGVAQAVEHLFSKCET
jgi:hypothetical protein